MDIKLALERLSLIYEIPADRLDELYVPRPDKVADRMAALLTEPAERAKILLAGQHGSGKTTELNRLETMLAGKYTIVRCGSRELMDMDDASDEIDFLLVLIATFLSYARSLDPAVSKVITKNLKKVGQPGIDAGVLLTMVGTAAPSNVTGTAGVTLKNSHSKQAPLAERAEARDELRKYRSQLISAIDKAIEAIELHCGPPVLLVVDDLEKVEYEQVRKLLSNYALTLASLPCAAIFSVSPWILFEGALLNRLRDQFHDIDLANVPLWSKDKPWPQSDAIPESFGFMADVFFRRVGGMVEWMTASSDVKSDQSRKKNVKDGLYRKTTPVSVLATASGGNLRQFVRLLREAFLAMSQEGRIEVEGKHVRQVILDGERDFQRMVTLEERQVLKRVLSERQYNRGLPSNLLSNLSVLEYWHPKWSTWYDVNPLTLPVAIGGSLVQELEKDPTWKWLYA